MMLTTFWLMEALQPIVAMESKLHYEQDKMLAGWRTSYHHRISFMTTMTESIGGNVHRAPPLHHNGILTSPFKHPKHIPSVITIGKWVLTQIQAMQPIS